MTDQRKVPRTRTFKAGVISYGTLAGIPCTVRNLSELGACLEIGSDSAIPDKFSLVLKPELKRRSCEVIWRIELKLGVHFV